MSSATGSGSKGRRISQPDGDGGSIIEDVIDSEADDAGDGLRIEKDERGRGPGPQGQGVVVEGPPENGESAVLVQRRLVLVDELGWQVEAGHPARLHAPAQERLGRAPGGRLLRVPGVDVRLPAVFEGCGLGRRVRRGSAGLSDLLFRLAGSFPSRLLPATGIGAARSWSVRAAPTGQRRLRRRSALSFARPGGGRCRRT
ncbi:hypothetical protein OG594_44900 [Streptomyces sp. NBC_01214]|uniref:hypothetical protein n=1 Tax=Streptomyces sp. NBC_01214 TaxID=2903777 RepID=UPI00225557ED|nr:hypothetical protein [Streptomyces sp. NBC_01214]MCX4808638.1 hypothetical protein [Streptomyces sp. NBC_01214]